MFFKNPYDRSSLANTMDVVLPLPQPNPFVPLWECKTIRCSIVSFSTIMRKKSKMLHKITAFFAVAKISTKSLLVCDSCLLQNKGNK